jgi:hypothetical protein
VKVKIKFLLCLIKRCAINTSWTNGGIRPSFDTKWRLMVDFTLRPVCSHEISLRTHSLRRLGAPYRYGHGRRKSCPYKGSNSNPSAVRSREAELFRITRKQNSNINLEVGCLHPVAPPNNTNPEPDLVISSLYYLEVLVCFQFGLPRFHCVPSTMGTRERHC